MDNSVKLERVQRLITAAYGAEWWNDERVTDYGVGIVDHSDDGAVWVTGNWNPTRFRSSGDDTPLTAAENIGPRLADALARYAGAETLWLDEWLKCDDCQRVFRGSPDSYSWRMRGLVTDDGSVVCDRCLLEDMETTLEYFVNDDHRAITFAKAADLEAVGFTLYAQPGDWREGTYENGFYEGQNDRPADVTAAIRREHGDTVDIVFLVPSVGQFDIMFQAYIRPRDYEG